MNTTFYDLLVALSEAHIPLKTGGFTDGMNFNQKQKRITVGNVVIYDNGIIPQTLILKGGSEIEIENQPLIEQSEDPYGDLEVLYHEYKTSVPTPYSEYLKSNFKALDINKISKEEFECGRKREVARTKLEAFVMFTEFSWVNKSHHYWQSEADKSLILRREWA